MSPGFSLLARRAARRVPRAHRFGLPRRRTERTAHETRWWGPFLVGAAAGLLASLLVRRGGVGGRGGDGDAGDTGDTGDTGDGGQDPDRWDRLRGAWDEAVEGAANGIAGARELFRERVEVDADAVERRVAAMACATECRVRLLGEGIVEVVGSCGSDDDARALLDAVSAEPGVEVVVNRVWTPASAGLGPPAPPRPVSPGPEGSGRTDPKGTASPQRTDPTR